MDDPRRSAESDLEKARAAIERGELQHAAGHLAGAIAQAPARPETHEVLTAFTAHAGADLPSLLSRIVMQLCSTVSDPAPEPGRSHLRPLLGVVRHAIAAHPEHHLLLGAGSALARRIGEEALAVDWAARGTRAQPSKLGEIWLGYAYRSAGRVPEALEALCRAVQHDPDDLSVYADIAGTLADHGRLDEALRWVDKALDRDPTFDCAVHTAHRLRFSADGELDHLVRLADFVRDHPDDTHEHSDLAECCADTPWLSRVPAAQDAQVDPRRAPIAATTASAAAVERLQRVAHPLWAHPPAAYDAAVELLLIEPDELLALIERPPPPPPTEQGRAFALYDPVLWERTARVWACLGLLHHDTEEPWLGSRRRRRLIALTDGGTDRITEAALCALMTAAWVEPQARPDVAAVVVRHLHEAAPGTDLAWSLAQLTLATPGADPAARRHAEHLIRAEEEHAVALIPRQRRSPARLLRAWRSRFTR